MTVSSALLLLANFRQSTRIKIRKKIPPSTISRICHHRRRPSSKTIGAVAPLDGLGGSGFEEEDEIVLEVVVTVVALVVAVTVVVEFGSCTKSDRQTPKLGITVVDPVQSEGTQDPARRT